MTPTPILLVDGHHGIYVPQVFAKRFDRSVLEDISHIDHETLLSGPDADEYWDAWAEVLALTFIRDKQGNRYYLYQDSDLWAVPVDTVMDNG